MTTQRQILHAPGELPGCAHCGRAFHYFDARGLRCGGGHSIECPCRHTTANETFDQALDEWRQINGLQAIPASRRGLRAVK